MLVSIGAFAFLVGACGGGGRSATSSTGAATRPASTAVSPSPAASAASASASSTVGQKITASPPAGAPVIDQKDVAFNPRDLTVQLGETIYFTNSEPIAHTVNLNGSNLLGPRGLANQGEAIAWKPAKAGTYEMTCDFHPAMRALITVR